VADVLNFTGLIREIHYHACLTEPLTTFPLAGFDINRAKAFGMIQTEDGELAYAKWVSPKRTQNYPLARVYQTYSPGSAAKKMTIIPVIKDDGREGDIEKIQSSTIAWLNLLNTYIVLGYYDQADRKKESDRNKLTNHRFNNDFIRSQIQDIATSPLTALQWNQNLLSERFTDIVRRALDAYWEISDRTGVKIHAYTGMDQYRDAVLAEFDAAQNKESRKAPIAQAFRYKGSSTTATFCVQDEWGGLYGIAPEEIVPIDGSYILQESKIALRKALPDLSEIQESLCKLILYSNLDTLHLNGEAVEFSTRLKLTGRGIQGQLLLPCESETIDAFLLDNVKAFYPQDHTTIRRLNVESEQNTPLEIEIGGSN
jgi:hypothetical protein